MNLSKNEQDKLHQSLVTSDHLFNGTLGSWLGETYDIELKEVAMPYHSRVYPTPKFHEKMLKHEVQ